MQGDRFSLRGRSAGLLELLPGMGTGGILHGGGRWRH